jgi:N-acetylneuraminic acid mutarotase
VLVVGGANHQQQWLGDAEVYDPTTDVWTVVPMLTSHGVEHTATLMNDGRVLVVGGAVGNGKLTDQVDIFDPQTNSWHGGMPLESDRASHTAQLLDDGRVLVAGGGSAIGVPAGGDALVYDPQTDSWTATGPMVYPRIFSESVRLSDGRVLVVGGINLIDTLLDGAIRNSSFSAEIYNPASNGWEATGDLSQARYGHVLIQLEDGRVLVSGGARDGDCCWTDDSYAHEIEIYDPGTGLWNWVEELPQAGVYSAGILLPDGRVLITGGESGEDGATFLSDMWFYTPSASQP